ncbi:MAG: alanine racemase [Gemmatimonadota bacterium]|nr:alanine racemase [Gemmatimonadota bacterium]
MSTNSAIDRAWVEVNLQNLVANARAVLKAGRGASLLPMVKADAYGLGVERVVVALETLNPWGFGVATIEEGAQLRDIGVSKPIVVFTPARTTQLPEYARYDLRPVLDCSETLSLWDGPFHLEIDTGMGRGGVRWDDTESIREAGVSEPEGVFTHFHSADESADSLRVQLERFERAVGLLGKRPALVHVANSAGSFRVSTQMDLVRPGIFLYGGKVGDDQPTPLPVTRFRTVVASIRTVRAGDTISYGADWTAEHTTRVATLSAGYADGIRRSVQGKAHVLIGGRPFPVTGRITMDMTMVDIGMDHPVRAGDIATIWGDDSGHEITLDQFGAWAGTISYEILTGLGKRVPRRYLGV